MTDHGKSRRKNGPPRRPTARPAPVLNHQQYAALAEFRRALRGFLAFSETATRQSGVTTQQYQALLAIKAHPNEALLVRELAHEMLLKHNNAVQLVDRLVKAKLVRRETSRDDRRAVVLKPTRLGEQKTAYLAAIHFRELLPRLGQFAHLARLASRMEQVS